jgi:hypothetical protein
MIKALGDGMEVIEEYGLVEECWQVCVLDVGVFLGENGVLKVKNKNGGRQVGMPVNLPARGFLL